MYLAFYKGKTIISLLIRFFTWSTFSHVSCVTDKGIEYESTKGGVQKGKFGRHYKKKIKVHIYKIVGVTKKQLIKFEKELNKYITRKVKYDYIGLTRFLTRIDRGNDKKVFCSEYLMEAARKAGIIFLANVASWKVSPATLSYSPKLMLAVKIKAGDNILKVIKLLGGK